MSTREYDIAKSIVRDLEHGTRTLDRRILAGLAQGRDRALAEYEATPEWRPAWAGHSKLRQFDKHTPGLRHALSVAILILGLIGIVFWQSGNGRGYELADIDARLLTDDLPLDAYLDKGFDSWLKRQSR